MSNGKFTLSQSQIRQLVAENKYSVSHEDRFKSRCVDGRYLNSEMLPALALPGGDAGQVAVIFAASNKYGFKIDEQKVWETVLEVVGGADNFSFHSDNHHFDGQLGEGCDHLSQMKMDPLAYGLEPTQVEAVLSHLPEVVEAGARQTVLEGPHLEVAAAQVEGNLGILPRFTLEAESGGKEIQIFVYHKSLVDERHKVLAGRLINNGAATLHESLDSEYLYQALSETAELHVFETLKKLAKGLPLYRIVFIDKMDYAVEEMGSI